MERAGPKRVAPMKHLTRRTSIYDWNPGFIKYDDVYRNGSVNDLMAMIPQYPEFREFGQSVVIRKVMESDDFERARKLVDQFTWESSNKDILNDLDHEQRIVNEDTSAELLKGAVQLRNESETFNSCFARLLTLVQKIRKQH